MKAHCPADVVAFAPQVYSLLWARIQRISALLALFTLLLIAPTIRAVETSAIDAVLTAAVQRGDVVGVVALAGTRDGVAYRGAFGGQSQDSKEKLSTDALFRIASMTKAITSVAAMQLVEEGLLGLDEAVADHLPRFAGLRVLEGFDASGEPQWREPTGRVTVKQLLTHTAGFGYEVWNATLLQAVSSGLMPGLGAPGESILDAPLVFDPGSTWHYGINTDWLGQLVASVRGKPLAAVFEEHIFAPLKMHDTGFIVTTDEIPRLSPVFARQADGSLAPVPIPPPTAETVTFASGGGGLVSTADDYARFLAALLAGGVLDGERILGEDTVELMAQNHIGDLEAGAMRTVMPAYSNDFDFFPGSEDKFGLGFLLNGEAVPGGRAAGSLAWAGLYNCYYWLDRETGIYGILMTQILPFADANVLELLGAFERAVYSAL